MDTNILDMKMPILDKMGEAGSMSDTSTKDAMKGSETKPTTPGATIVLFTKIYTNIVLVHEKYSKASFNDYPLALHYYFLFVFSHPYIRRHLNKFTISL